MQMPGRPALAGIGLDDEGLVRGLPLFAAIDAAQLARLLVGGTVSTHDRNAVLFVRGEPATRFFVVLDG